MIRRINAEACIGCGVCEIICPGNVIVIDGTTKKAQTKYVEDCWTCFSCEMSCPVKAIFVDPFRKAKPLAW